MKSAALNAPWMSEPALARVLEVLGHDQARLVGGCVRDGLLGLPVNDIDIATVHTPKDVIARTQQAGMKAISTGIDHGTVTVVARGNAFEVTTLRRDIETDGRHAVVAFTDNWRADAARRDFTINALYADASGTVLDYFGGLDDLVARRVCFIGDAGQRIAEDALRILRFYRFSARYADYLDARGRAACRAAADMLQRLSRERIAQEWLKILGHPGPVATVTALIEDGCFHGILGRQVHPLAPSADIISLQRVAQRELALGLTPDPLRRMAALLPIAPEDMRGLATSLRLSNRQAAALVDMATPASVDMPMQQLLYRDGPDLAVSRTILSEMPESQVADLRAAAKDWTRPVLPVAGADVLAAGLSGPDVGAALKRLEADWIASGFTLTREDLLPRI